MPLNQIQQTFRKLWSNRGFSSSVVLTLGLGMGATVTVFSIVYAVLIRPLPYLKPADLFSVFQSKTPNDDATRAGLSPANFTDFRRQNRAFTDLAAYCGFHYTLTGNREPEMLNGTAVSSGLFDILGVHPVIGRNFLPQEDSYSAEHAVILSHRVWSEKFRSDPRIVGKSISLNGDSFYVAGVMGADFHFFEGEYDDLWIPLQQQIRPDRMLWRDQSFLGVVGRLRPGVTLDQARADTNRIATQLHAQYSISNRDAGAVVMPLQQALVGETKVSLLLSLGIAGFVLLIAGANVAILMLARVSGRIREISVRCALGAGMWRIMIDVLLESVVLGLISGLTGTALALAGQKLLLHFLPEQDVFKSIQINPAVLAFAVVTSAVAGLGFGLFPALLVSRTDIQKALRNAGNTSTSDVHGRRLRHLLMVGEISLAVVLLFGTGLLLRSLLRLEQQPLGFRTDHVVTARINLPRTRYQDDKDVAQFFDRLHQRLQDLPERSVGLAYPLPIVGNPFWTNFNINGRDASPGEYEHASLRFIDSGFFSVMNIPVLSGRNLSDADDRNAQPVAVVSGSLARKYWPGEDAVGRYITIVRAPEATARIVGVVGDVRAEIEDDPLPTIYVSYKQVPFRDMAIVMVAPDSSGPVLGEVRRAVQSVDAQQPVASVESMESLVHDFLGRWRFALLLLGGLTGLAVMLTVVGLFAVLSYLVRERIRELGMRMAIGASRNDILLLVLRQSLRLALYGIGLGLLLTLGLLRFASRVDYAIRPNDPVAYLLVSTVVAMISILAAYLPARRASQINPLVALREE